MEMVDKKSISQRPIIAFMSDLGTFDDSVGICKGLIVQVYFSTL